MRRSAACRRACMSRPTQWRNSCWRGPRNARQHPPDVVLNREEGKKHNTQRAARDSVRVGRGRTRRSAHWVLYVGASRGARGCRRWRGGQIRRKRHAQVMLMERWEQIQRFTTLDIEETKKKVPASSPSPRLPLLADNEDDPCKLRRLNFLPEPRS